MIVFLEWSLRVHPKNNKWKLKTKAKKKVELFFKKFGHVFFFIFINELYYLSKYHFIIVFTTLFFIFFYYINYLSYYIFFFLFFLFFFLFFIKQILQIYCKKKNNFLLSNNIQVVFCLEVKHTFLLWTVKNSEMVLLSLYL